MALACNSSICFPSRRNSRSPLHMEPLGSKGFLQPGKDKHDIFTGARMAHKTLSLIHIWSISLATANYRSVTSDGKAIKSTTILIRDDEKKAIGALCINFDMTSFHKAKKAFDEFAVASEIDLPGEKVVEIDNADVVDILDHLVSRTIEEYGKSPEQMSREDKIQIVGYLDEKGLFRIKGAVNWVAKKLGTSRYTIYNYLEAARAERAMDEKR